MSACVCEVNGIDQVIMNANLIKTQEYKDGSELYALCSISFFWEDGFLCIHTQTEPYHTGSSERILMWHEHNLSGYAF